MPWNSICQNLGSTRKTVILASSAPSLAEITSVRKSIPGARVCHDGWASPRKMASTINRTTTAASLLMNNGLSLTQSEDDGRQCLEGIQGLTTGISTTTQ